MKVFCDCSLYTFGFLLTLSWRIYLHKRKIIIFNIFLKIFFYEKLLYFQEYILKFIYARKSVRNDTNVKKTL